MQGSISLRQKKTGSGGSQHVPNKPQLQPQPMPPPQEMRRGSASSDRLFLLLLSLVTVVGLMDCAIFYLDLHSSVLQNGASDRRNIIINSNSIPFESSALSVTTSEDRAALHHLDKRLFTGEIERHEKQNSKVQVSNSKIERNGNQNSNVNDKANTSNEDTRVQQILQNSGVELTDDLLSKLPTWNEVVSLYGPKPKIYGLETCRTYQSTIPINNALIGPAGIFNTGTNLLADLLLHNCHIPGKTKYNSARERTGMLWQVPWGKHNPVSWRTKNIAIVGGKGVVQTNVLPVVTIKDPYHWMGSMCRHSYAANWKHTLAHCPNLVPSEEDIKFGLATANDPTIPVSVHFKQQNITHHDTLVGLWNDWYGDYKAISEYPRLIVRFEDLLFHLEEVLTEVCHCGGGKLKDPSGRVSMMEASAKGSTGAHDGANGLVAAILRYGSLAKRAEGMTREDLEYARRALDKDLMEDFGYTFHPP